MKLTGYSSSVFVRPGESLGFHVHSESPNVDVQLVRLLHGDENPRGPGFQEREISSSIDGRHAAGPQEIFRGSFAELETPLRLIERDDFEIDLWIWPTRPSIGRQGIISWRAPECPEGLCLALDETGRVIAQSGTREVVRARQPLAGRAWVRIRLQGRGGLFELSIIPRDYSPRYDAADVCDALHGEGLLFGRHLTIAATSVELDRKPASAFPGFQRQDFEALASFRRRDAMRVRLCDRAARAPPDRRQARPRCDQPQSSDSRHDRTLFRRSGCNAGRTHA